MRKAKMGWESLAGIFRTHQGGRGGQSNIRGDREIKNLSDPLGKCCSGKTPSSLSQTLEGLFELTRCPSRTFDLPCALIPELQGIKDTGVRCAALDAEVPGQRQEQLTLIVRLLKTCFRSSENWIGPGPTSWPPTCYGYLIWHWVLDAAVTRSTAGLFQRPSGSVPASRSNSSSEVSQFQTCSVPCRQARPHLSQRTSWTTDLSVHDFAV